jgi:hypothetical protein
VVHVPEIEIERKARNCETEIQIKAVETECRRHFQNLHEIDEGRIPLLVDTPGYFRYFLDIAMTNEEPEDVTIFARLVNLEVRQKIRDVGFKNLFPSIKAAVDGGKLRMEYLLFLQSPNSLDDPETKTLVEAYQEFSERVALVFQDGAVAAEDAVETFVLLKTHKWVLTHGWDYSGRISTPVHWMKVGDYNRYFERYRRIQFHCQLIYKRD